MRYIKRRILFEKDRIGNFARQDVSKKTNGTDLRFEDIPC